LGVVAVALAIWSLALEIPDRKLWATTLQLVGGAVAFLGFSSAYVRARYGLTLRAWIWQWVSGFGRWAKRMWDKLRRKRRSISINVPSIVITAQMGTPHIKMYPGALALDETLPLEQQIAQIAEYANKLQAEVPKLLDEVHRLDGRIDQAQAGASDLAQETLTHLRDEISELRTHLDWAQVLDLRWAIVGLFITVVGIALSY
jgi:hypothetical protein